MSMFLGPIHFWLYEKIKRQEELTAAVSEYIGSGQDLTKKCPPLEEIIDEDNIHASLQNMINDSEERFARLIIINGKGKEKEILSCAHKFGEENKINPNATPESAYKAFEDFFINGMPCDRINAVVRSDVNSITWKLTADIHEKYYSSLGADDALYYKIRHEIMHAMLEETQLTLTVDGDTYTLSC